MKLNRFFCEQRLKDLTSVTLHSISFLKQVRNVFRLEIDDKIILFDNSGYDFLSTINKYEKDCVTLSILESNKNNVSQEKEIYLFASIVKKDNFEWIVQKATELGVSHIIPILSERSEKKNINIERINKIIIEASEQSGRGIIPTLHDIYSLDLALNKFGNIKSIVWDPQAIKFSREDLVETVGTYIGPEGGWSSKEINLFENNKIIIRSLGPQILRSETAVIATLSTLVF